VRHLTDTQRSAITTIGMDELEAFIILDFRRGIDVDVFPGLERIVIRNWPDGKEDIKAKMTMVLRKVTRKEDLEVVFGRYL
jgi:hypothetical protein